MINEIEAFVLDKGAEPDWQLYFRGAPEGNLRRMGFDAMVARMMRRRAGGSDPSLWPDEVRADVQREMENLLHAAFGGDDV
jgi:hypothetical protein